MSPSSAHSPNSVPQKPGKGLSCCIQPQTTYTIFCPGLPCEKCPVISQSMTVAGRNAAPTNPDKVRRISVHRK